MFVEIFVRNRFIVSNSPAATATNIHGNELLFRIGFAADNVSFAAYLVLTALLYQLFRPVNKSISLIAVYFSLVACVVQAFSSLFHLAPLVLQAGTPYLRAFSAEQLQALALLFLKLRAMSYHNIGLVFFGFYCLLIGYLVLKSRFLPRVIGVLMMLGGLSYAAFLFPPLDSTLQPYILVFPTVGQISLTLWLLFAGVNAERWNQQAKASFAT